MPLSMGSFLGASAEMGMVVVGTDSSLPTDFSMTASSFSFLVSSMSVIDFSTVSQSFSLTGSSLELSFFFSESSSFSVPAIPL